MTLPHDALASNLRLGPRTPWRSRLAAVGVYLPERRMRSETLMRECHPLVRPLDLEAVTGIRERRICAENEDALTLATNAARDCLRRSSLDGRDLEMVISSSISRMRAGLDFQYEPPLSLELKTAIGAPEAIHFDLVNACAGMLTGVMVLDDFIRRGEIRRGMVVSGECLSNVALNAAADMDCLPNDQIASLTVGDAGAAVILERTDRDAPGFENSEFRTVAAFDDLCIGRPRQGGPGIAMLTKAKELQEIALQEIVPFLRELLSEHGGDISQVQCFIPHQTSSKTIELGTTYLCHELGVAPPRHVAITVCEYGNTASTTHFLALHHLLCDGKLGDGDRVLLLCYASGIVVGYSLLMLDGVAKNYGR